MNSILSKSFKYQDSAHTNIKLRFDRERKRLAEEAASQKAKDEAQSIEAAIKVRVLRGAK